MNKVPHVLVLTATLCKERRMRVARRKGVHLTVWSLPLEVSKVSLPLSPPLSLSLFHSLSLSFLLSLSLSLS